MTVNYCIGSEKRVTILDKELLECAAKIVAGMLQNNSVEVIINEGHQGKHTYVELKSDGQTNRTTISYLMTHIIKELKETMY